MTPTTSPRRARLARLMPEYDVHAIRAHFPALSRSMPDGRPVAWLDGPAGTQAPQACLDGIVDYLSHSSTNNHGRFAASVETDALLEHVHLGMAAYLGANDPGEISFGPNMTTITFAISRAIGQAFEAGDEIVLTRLDHDANVAPWLALAHERDLLVRWIDIDPEDCTLRLDNLEEVIGPRTRLVAVGLASNAVGSINPVRRISDVAHSAGALVYVDAVHAAPHIPIDVGELGADYLVCSTYKFYGPHLGVLWGRRDLLEALPAYHVRPAGEAIPGRFETGTQAHELMAGLAGTLRYLEGVGTSDDVADSRPGTSDGLRERLLTAVTAAGHHERELVWRLIEGLEDISGVRVRGITDRARAAERCPTVSFELDHVAPADVSRHLGDEGIYTWDGDYYAWELIRRLGLAEQGGMVRVGIVAYNTEAEVDRVLEAVESLAAR
jgi:cysteine desulfurase family protein (TIGR01976 family)